MSKLVAHTRLNFSNRLPDISLIPMAAPTVHSKKVLLVIPAFTYALTIVFGYSEYLRVSKMAKPRYPHRLLNNKLVTLKVMLSFQGLFIYDVYFCFAAAQARLSRKWRYIDWVE